APPLAANRLDHSRLGVPFGGGLLDEATGNGRPSDLDRLALLGAADLVDHGRPRVALDGGGLHEPSRLGAASYLASRHWYHPTLLPVKSDHAVRSARRRCTMSILPRSSSSITEVGNPAADGR